MNGVYTTVGGETWTLIAEAIYGDRYRAPDLIGYNSDLPTYTVFPAGVPVNYELSDADVSPSPQTLMPPWKR